MWRLEMSWAQSAPQRLRSSNRQRCRGCQRRRARPAAATASRARRWRRRDAPQLGSLQYRYWQLQPTVWGRAQRMMNEMCWCDAVAQVGSSEVEFCGGRWRTEAVTWMLMLMCGMVGLRWGLEGYARAGMSEPRRCICSSPPQPTYRRSSLQLLALYMLQLQRLQQDARAGAGVRIRSVAIAIAGCRRCTTYTWHICMTY